MTDPSGLLPLDPAFIPGAVFGLAFLFVAALAFGLSPTRNERRLHQRIDRIKAPTSQARSVNAAQQHIESLRRNRNDSSFAGLDKLMKAAIPNLGLMRLRLERSGLTLKVGDFMLVCLGLCVAAAGTLTLTSGLPVLFNVLAGVAVGIGLPHIYIGRLISRRVRQFTALLPEALDLIVRGIRSGLPATEAINTIGTEIADPIGSEFRRASDQVKIGVNLDEALWQTARRLRVPEFNFLVISLSIQQETGGNLAEILEKLSDMVRRREQMKLKIKAMSSEARASAMIIGSLPFVMGGLIYLINPGYMDKLLFDPRGWVMLAVGATSMTFGVVVMAKLVKFDI